MKEEILGIHKIFLNNVLEVENLMKFDNLVLRHAIHIMDDFLEGSRGKIDLAHPLLGPAKNAKRSLENIKEHETLKTYYKTMHNQCIVLLVTHFSSALHDLFKQCFDLSSCGNKNEIMRKKYEFAIEEFLEYHEGLNLAEIILRKDKGINFQDMQSIKRTFGEYFNISLDKRLIESEHNIIFAQGCRHCIVHDSSRVNKKIMSRFANAKNRSIKLEIQEGDEIEFDPSEIDAIRNSMIEFVEYLCEKVMKEEVVRC